MKKDIKEIQRQQTILRNAFVEVALQSGAIERVTKLMSANYLLISHSVVIVDDIEDILKRHKLQSGKLKNLSKKLQNAYYEYFKEYSRMVSSEQVLDWAEDLTKFGEVFSRFTGIKSEWEPETEKVNIEEIEKKYNVKLVINQAERR